MMRYYVERYCQAFKAAPTNNAMPEFCKGLPVPGDILGLTVCAGLFAQISALEERAMAPKGAILEPQPKGVVLVRGKVC